MADLVDSSSGDEAIDTRVAELVSLWLVGKEEYSGLADGSAGRS